MPISSLSNNYVEKYPSQLSLRETYIIRIEVRNTHTYRNHVICQSRNRNDEITLALISRMNARPKKERRGRKRGRERLALSESFRAEANKLPITLRLLPRYLFSDSWKLISQGGSSRLDHPSRIIRAHTRIRFCEKFLFRVPTGEHLFATFPPIHA